MPYGPPPPPPCGPASAGAAGWWGAPKSDNAAYAGLKLSTHTAASKDKRGLPELDVLPEYPA
eukprot:6161012-Alexandrium_andersonii.AAC.1